MSFITRLIGLVFLPLVFLGGSAAGAQEIEPAPDFEQKFDRVEGWTGADGTYSYLLDDGSVLWSFSDTFWGRVVDGHRVDFRMENNSQVLQRSGELKFLKSPSFVPPDGVGWFWMCDGIFDGDLQVLLGQIEHRSGGVFGFEQTGLWYARASLESDRLVVKEYRKLPFFQRRDERVLTFGSAVLRDGAWDYILGTRDTGDRRECTLARAPRGCLGMPGVWRFYDGTTWVRDPWQAVALFANASMESSVHRTRDGGYLYVGSKGLLGEVVARYASSLQGPWSDPVAVFRAPEAEGNVFVYNAKAHPELSTENRLLISYNVNTFDLEEVVQKADIYRPRFIWWTPKEQGWLP